VQPRPCLPRYAGPRWALGSGLIPGPSADKKARECLALPILSQDAAPRGLQGRVRERGGGCGCGGCPQARQTPGLGLRLRGLARVPGVPRGRRPDCFGGLGMGPPTVWNDAPDSGQPRPPVEDDDRSVRLFLGAISGTSSRRTERRVVWGISSVGSSPAVPRPARTLTSKAGQMKARRLLVGFTLCFLCFILCLAACPAPAEEVIEAWRSPFGTPLAVSLNRTDGSCWAATGNSVMHLADNGVILSQTNGFRNAIWLGPDDEAFAASLSANSTDGSCWVADTYHNQVVHLAADGSELWRGEGFTYPMAVSANPSDGSCWVASWGSGEVVHLAANGSQLWRGPGFPAPKSVSVNSADGSCWVGDYTGITHLDANGTQLWRVDGGASSVSVNSTDGSCWVGGAHIKHLAANGAELWSGGLSPTYCVTVNPVDGSCWVGDLYHRQILLLSESGEELWQAMGFGPVSISSDPQDGSCWMANVGQNQIVHLAASGAELWRGSGCNWPEAVSVNPTDGSCWVADTSNDQVVHLAADGAELWRGGDFYEPDDVSANSADGSCWVADDLHHQIVHLAQNGYELWRGGPPPVPYSGTRLAVDPTDGSCWTIASTSEVVRLAPDGTELWRGAGFSSPVSVSVNPTDGSCWVAGGELVHLSRDGVILWQGSGARFVAVNASDGSCWIVDANGIAHLASDGSELWRGSGYAATGFVALSANWTNGSCWVADKENSRLVHLAASGAELWRGGDLVGPRSVCVNPNDDSVWVTDTENGQMVRFRVPWFADLPFDHWAYDQIGACAVAHIVGGYPDASYRPDLPVTRDQMAVYVSRALVIPTGDAAIPDPVPPATFSDVASTHWAYKHIEYAVAQNVVKGYDDGTYKPDLVVDRGQMAVFVARAMVTPSGDAGIPDPVPPATFPDVLSDFWAYKQVEYCVGQGVVKGYDDGTYRPGDPVTRDQMAVYVARAFKLPI